METALRGDALTAVPGGFELRLGLPWIRSMPLSSVLGLAVEVDGGAVSPGELAVVLGARRVPPAGLQEEAGWWFVQDRLVVHGGHALAGGSHLIGVDFQLLVPYLQAAPGRPLVLPFHVEARLDPLHTALPAASRDVA